MFITTGNYFFVGIYPLSATKAAEDGGNGGQTVDITAAAFAFFWQVPGAMVNKFNLYSILLE